MIHHGTEGPNLKKAASAEKKLKPGDELLVSINTFSAIKKEIDAIVGEEFREPGIQIMEVWGHRIIASAFIPDGEMWACKPI